MHETIATEENGTATRILFPSTIQQNDVKKYSSEIQVRCYLSAITCHTAPQVSIYHPLKNCSKNLVLEGKLCARNSMLPSMSKMFHMDNLAPIH